MYQKPQAEILTDEVPDFLVKILSNSLPHCHRGVTLDLHMQMTVKCSENRNGDYENCPKFDFLMLSMNCSRLV